MHPENVRNAAQLGGLHLEPYQPYHATVQELFSTSVPRSFCNGSFWRANSIHSVLLQELPWHHHTAAVTPLSHVRIVYMLELELIHSWTFVAQVKSIDIDIDFTMHKG